MENNSTTSAQLIADSYKNYYHSVLLYVSYKINSKEDAEDLSQDVFLRLMDYGEMIRPETVKSFIYTIARNLVTDYLRRYYCRQEYFSYIYDTTTPISNATEAEIIANDLCRCEERRIKLLPPQRRKVYAMSRFEGKTISDISEELNLSSRTVENHLFIGRKEIREYMKQCI